MQHLGSNPTLQTGENNAQASRQKGKTKSEFAVKFFASEGRYFYEMSCSWPLLNNSAFSEVKGNDANTENC
jgi:hypothetical protein